MAEIEQVTRYRTDDGSVFETLKQAEAYEAKDRLRNLLHRRSSYGDIAVKDAVDEMIENADDYIAILSTISAGATD